MNNISTEKLLNPASGSQQINFSRPTATATHDQEPSTILSPMPLSDVRLSMTLFEGYTKTIPVKEIRNVGWTEGCNSLRPPIPKALVGKKTAPYVIPCLLKDAPLIGITLQNAKKKGAPTVGKMRSKDHVTEGSMLMMDVDGLSEADFAAGLDKIKTDGLTYLAYTTFSHGDPKKTGVRARLVIPLDCPVTAENYGIIWHALDKRYFDGKVGKEDSSSSKLSQLQGTWCCNFFHKDKAKSWSHEGGVVSTSFLLKSGEVVQEIQADKKEVPAPKERKNTADTPYPPSDAKKIADGCKQIGNFRDTKGAGQSEPLWFDGLGVVAHCKDGEVICQEWSGGYSGYDKDETAKKIAHRKQTPPTTCEQFKKTNPEGCKGCTQKCNSPIALGMEPMAQEGGALAAIQKHFALINFGSKIWVLDLNALEARNKEGLAKQFEVSNRSDGKLMIKRFLEANYPQADAVKIIEEFWIRPQTKCYEGVDFNPKGTSEKFLNLWVGPTVTPKAGNCDLIKAFLLEVICSGDQKNYDYLIGYMAHALQRPEEKPGVMIILKGGQGTGKGTLGRILRKIWSATYLQVNNITAVTGSFNAALERAFFVFMDEALFSGNRGASDALKSLVTEPIIPINQKYQPSRQIDSYHRFFAATNAEHFKNTEHDDRRDVTLRLSEIRKGDHAYWVTLHNKIENEGVEALAYELLAMDLSTFNVRIKPDTKELLDEKLMSLNSIERWWHEGLRCGSLSENVNWLDFVATTDAIAGILELSGGRMYRKPSGTDIKQILGKICPSAQYAQKQTQFGRHRGFSLPSLQQCRAEFEVYIGDTVQWEPEEFIEELPPNVLLSASTDRTVDSQLSTPF